MHQLQYRFIGQNNKVKFIYFFLSFEKDEQSRYDVLKEVNYAESGN